MMSAMGETGQQPKKKLPTYGRAVAKPRPQNTAAAKTTRESPQSSQPPASTPSKDIYDYDFVDDDPAPRSAKSEARPKPKPLPSARGTPKAAGPATLSAMTASLALKNVPSPQRTQPRTTGEPSRGIKRKPSYFETTSSRQTSSTSTVASSITAALGNKEHHRPPASVERATALAPAAPLFKNTKPIAKPISKTSAPGSSLSGSPVHPRVAKTPPRSVTKTPTGAARVPSVSPGKGRSPAASALINSRKTPLSRPAHQVPFRPVGSQPTPSQPSHKRPESTKQPQQPPAQRKRRRLIDALAAQQEEDESEEEEDSQRVSELGGDAETSSQSETVSSKRRYPPSSPVSDGRGAFMELESLATLSPGRVSLAPSTPATVSRRVTTRRPGVKFTYNLERTMLAEDPVALGGSSGGSDLSLLQSLLPEPESQTSAFDFDDDAGGSQGAIQSIHELRQAGANSRYADELVDILDRIGKPSSGKPSSTRRSALLEMVQKLQEKSFLRHFRDQGSEVQLFRDVGKETDPISGFALTCIVVTLLTNAATSNRLFRELRQQNAVDLFARLLHSETDIVVLARDRKSNVSNFGRQVLATIKETMRKLAIWKPAPTAPAQLSPRTLALKALHMYAQQTQAAAGDDEGILSKALTKQLFDIVQSELPSAYDEVDLTSSSESLLATGLSSDAESVDFYLSLSLLEMHSVAAMQSDIGAEWTRHYIPIIADALEFSLKEHQKNKRRLNDLELLVLKLALNTANNNPEAARFYVDKGLLRRLAELGCASLESVVHSVKTGENFASEALEELLLMLGVMINFSENDATAGETLVEGSGPPLFDQLGKFFLDGAAVTADADSEEKSQLNVAFAYLSILLGYLCLHDPIYQAFKKLSPSGNLRPLLESINQFIAFHDQLGKTNEADNGAEMSHFTARLRALAHELEVRAY